MVRKQVELMADKGTDDELGIRKRRMGGRWKGD